MNDERSPSKKLRFESETQDGLVDDVTSGQVVPKSELSKKKRKLLFEDEQPKDSAFTADTTKRKVRFDDDCDVPHDPTAPQPATKNRLKFKEDETTPDISSEDTIISDSGGSAPKSKTAATADGKTTKNLISSTGQPTKQLQKSKFHVDKTEAQLATAQDKLAAQKPYKPPGLVRQLGSFVAWRYAHRKVHQKIHEVEHENVGTESAHKTELAIEGGVRTTSRFTKRRIRTRPARQVRKLAHRNARAKANHAYNQLLHDNPALKKKTIARMYHKRRLKMSYAKQARQSVQTAKHGGSLITRITTKLGRTAVMLVKGNPKVILIVAIFFVLLLLLQSCIAMISTIGSGMGGVVVSTSYLAESVEISDVTVRYTDWETDLRYQIIHVQRDRPGYDEYRFSIGDISHNPFELVSFFTAVYHDFTYAQVRATLYDIFNEQYQLEFISTVEIRTRVETRTGSGSWTDDEGNTHSYTYTYTAVVEYEWWILNTVLTSQPLINVIMPRMDEEQTEHFNLLMLTKGNRQYLQSPFPFNWLPHVSSLFGYRIHPITGLRSKHWGLDIALPTGTEILSGQDGTVIFAAYAGGYGYLVVIDDGEGLVSRYAHCSIIYVRVGDVVSVGDVIARVGSTGASTGPHLHLEIIKNGWHLNPLIFTVTNHHLAW